MNLAAPCRRLAGLLAALAVFVTCPAGPARSEAAQEDRGGAPRAAAVFDPTEHFFYRRTKPENLAVAMWALDKYAATDKDMLEQFFMTTECDKYFEILGDDFTWSLVMERFKEHVSANKDNFNRLFYIVQPVMLDEYDFDKGWFAIKEGWEFDGTKRMLVSSNEIFRHRCNTEYVNRGHPSNAMIVYRFPFSLYNVPMDEYLAQDYVDYLKDKKLDISEGKPVYMKLYFEFGRFMEDREMLRGPEPMVSIFYGYWHKYEIYADRNLDFLLYEKVNDVFARMTLESYLRQR